MAGTAAKGAGLGGDGKTEPKSKVQVDLDLLEEDDEFEEIPTDDSRIGKTKEDDDDDDKVWEVKWDDDGKIIDKEDFSQQLRAEFEKPGFSKTGAKK